MLFILNFMTA